jgi:dihydrodipicolinate synthase/N-acetylneuraminate lyase
VSAPFGRRRFLAALGAGVVAAGQPVHKPMRGLFPIGYSPFTDSDQLDLECLAAQVRFLNKGGVHGVIWPQIASEWTTLSKKERLDGAEAMLAAGKGGKTAIVIGVQGPDLAAALEYARHAEKNGADGVCSLPPAGVTDEAALLEYYRQLGSATGLELFVQSQPFPMSVDLIARMHREIPTFSQIKDEAGDTLARIAEIRSKSGNGVKVFTGNGVRNMIAELMLGAEGYCPYTDVADVYAQTFDLWHAGKRAEAFDMFGRVLSFLGVVQAAHAPQKYILVARGVLKNTKRRIVPRTAESPFTAEGEKMVRAGLELLKPYLRA